MPSAGFNACQISLFNSLYASFSRSLYHRPFTFQIAGNWESADLDDRQRAILEYAMDVLNCRPISDEKIASLEKHGLSKDDAWDIGSAVAYMCLVNRMVIMLNVKPNDDFYTLGRTPKAPKPK